MQDDPLNVVYDDSNNALITLLEPTSAANYTGATDFVVFRINLNKSALLNSDADKIIVTSKVLDKAQMNLSDIDVRIIEFAGNYGTDEIYEQTFNLDQNKTTITAGIVLDPTKMLKLSSNDDTISRINIEVYSNSADNELDSAIIGCNVEIDNVKKVDSNMICNAMLAVGGFVMTIGAFTATPFWNPTRRRRKW